jgi:peptidoglycan/xylan/chitin deacetylase (PgdA/CDA1 family)
MRVGLTQKVTRLMRGSCLFLRKYVCELLALSLIASGCVRRAKRRAFRDTVITPIYFHKPNKGLFFRCIQWLTKNGYTFISANDVLDFLYHRRKLPSGAVWLSFDDGYKMFGRDLFPTLLKYRIPITLFIPTGIIEADGVLPWMHSAKSCSKGRLVDADVRDTLTVTEVKQLASYPEVTIGSHTISHAITSTLTEEEAAFEFTQSKRTIESWTNSECKWFAYPEGRLDGLEQPLLSKVGYDLAATTESAFITPDTDPYRLPRFNVGDEISLPEAICNMVGVWRPAMDPLIRFLQRWGRITDPLWEASGTASVRRSRPTY